MQEETQHIEDAELPKLLEESRCRAEKGLEAGGVHPHLAVCPACRKNFEELAALDRRLESMRPTASEQRHSDCPKTKVWREIAVGLTQSGETLGYIEHASRCGHCGPLLREAVAEFADLDRELTEEERDRIASLDSGRTEWQERLARQIAGTTGSAPDWKATPWWQKRLSVPRMAMAGATVLAVVGVGSWVALHQGSLYQSWLHRDQRSVAADLLARAYTEKRTLELRIAGAAYAPISVTRGPGGSFTDRPKELLNAEALIASQLESQPASASWLQAQAQADVLEGKYDPAVETLRRALELEAHSPAILIDLGTAYFQRAQQPAQEKDRSDDFDAAYEYLSQALKLSPDDPVALFNRAIVAEHLFLYHQALDDWDHYLRVDPGSQWAEDARNRANGLRAKLKDHQSQATPLLSPDRLLATASGVSPPAEVDQRIEEYLDTAVRSWSPQAFPEAGVDPGPNKTRPDADPQASPALFFLADLTSQRHGDHWLADLLSGSSAPHFPQALTALARASTANHSGEYDISRKQADLAERLFRASGNPAGVLRAQFEQAFAAQFDRRSEDCRQKASSALTESQRHSYPWLQVQLSFEKSVCSGLMGDLGMRKRTALYAMQRAQQAGYGALYLRALTAAADDEFTGGDPSRGSELARAGLQSYWSGQFPSRRGYGLYTELAVHAQAVGRSNLQEAIWREAVALIDSDENKWLRALAHNEMAAAAIAANLPQVAEREYAEAGRVFAAAPRSEASRNSALEVEVRTAQLQAHLGRFDDAIARLTAVQDQIHPLSNNYLVQMFYSTLGELQVGRHREVEAEQALRPALALAEQSLSTLRSEADRTRWSKDAAPAYLSLVEAQLAQGRSREALDTYEWYLGAPQRAATDLHSHRTLTDPPMPDPSLLASSRSFPTKATVLVYALLPDGLAVWVYDDHDIDASWIPKPTDGLQELAKRLHDLSSDPKSELSALRQDARSLYETLIAPVEQHFEPGRTLVIEADGWLARVPFEILLDANGHYLIERAPIVHSLGQDSQARLHPDTGISADSPALVVGSTASSPAEGLIPLPDVAAEADAVASGFHSARVLKGGGATLSAIQSALPGTAIFHFAGHSLTTPGKTGLMLESGDAQANAPRLLDADAVRQLRLQSLQLAVLSACSTASGSGTTNGFDSVSDALLRAGVPHVVASRWAVGSDETQEFVQDFYRNVLSGQTISEAIRLTSLKLMSDRDESHPYYWSAFAAYGRP